MRALQKLVRNGNSTQVTIPRTVLHFLGWLPGEAVILELTDQHTLVVRRPGPNEFAPQRMTPMMLDTITPVQG